MIFVVLCPGAPEGSTGSCSAFKAVVLVSKHLRRRGNSLKSLPTDCPYYLQYRLSKQLSKIFTINLL